MYIHLLRSSCEHELFIYPYYVNHLLMYSIPIMFLCMEKYCQRNKVLSLIGLWFLATLKFGILKIYILKVTFDKYLCFRSTYYWKMAEY